MHVDGFRFDLGSIFTRAHSQWHDVGTADTAGAVADVDQPDEPKAAVESEADDLMEASAGLGSSPPPAPPPPPAAPGELKPAQASA